MIKTFNFKPRGVCSQMITIELDDNKISDLIFYGGCSGNTQGVTALSKGMTIDEVIKKVEGIKCGSKNTSCPDQLAQALKQIKAEYFD